MKATQPPLLFIFGAAAVGKMTVGQELKRRTGYRLLYNHMVVDLVTEFFEFGTPGFHRLAQPFTSRIIEACADEGLGLITTHGLIFNDGGRALIERWERPYRERGMPVLYVALTAPLDVRIARSGTPHRAQHKKTDWATPERLREMEDWGRFTFDAEDDWPDPARRITIDNSHLAPEAVAERIQRHFGLAM